MRTLVIALALGAALATAVPATAAAPKAKPSEAQATHVAQRLAQNAADGLLSYGIFDLEHVSVSCRHPFGSSPGAIRCGYALYLHNTQDGSGAICVSSVDVFRTRTGRIQGRYATQQSCF